MSPPAGNPNRPFLDVQSFTAEEVQPATPNPNAYAPATAGTSRPFLSVYELEGETHHADPDAEDYVAFINELHDDELDEATFELVHEAASLYEERFTPGEDEEPDAAQAERFLEEHFAPLVNELEAMVGTLADTVGTRDPNSAVEGEIESFLDDYQPNAPLSPNFENFFGRIKKAFKKAAKKAVKFARKGVKTLGKLGLGAVLRKLRPLVKPLLKRVLRVAIRRLPRRLQPVARTLARRVRFLREVEEDYAPLSGNDAVQNMGEIQQEFNVQLANLLYAEDEAEQELELARVSRETDDEPYSLADLDKARAQFVQQLGELEEGEDPTPLVENFLPAILPALKLGIKLIGRKRVVNFLAKLVARLIRRFTGPQVAPALSRAIVDSGLKLVRLEATPEDEASAAGGAVAATVEDTVRRVADLPDEVLDDDELLEGFVLEAFENAAAANLPPVLSERAYRARPELLESQMRGTWLMMPLRGAKRYKKYSRVLRAKLSPHKLMALKTFGGVPLAEVLHDQMGVPPGESVEAEVHLYESVPGTMLPQLAEMEGETYHQLHPLTSDAANLLVGEPGLGRDVATRYVQGRSLTDVGQRFYHLVIPGTRPRYTPGGVGARRSSTLKLTLDFPAGQIRARLFLSEARAQRLAKGLRQGVPVGTLLGELRQVLGYALPASLRGGTLGVIHEALLPDKAGGLARVPAAVLNALNTKLQVWLLRALADHLRQPQPLIRATEDAADGVTLMVSLNQPPGIGALRQLLSGRGTATGILFEGSPTADVTVAPGYVQE